MLRGGRKSRSFDGHFGLSLVSVVNLDLVDPEIFG